MPTCFFVPDVPFVWPSQPAAEPGGGLRPPPPPRPASATPGPRNGPRTRKSKPKRKSTAGRVIAPSIRTEMIDRIEAATLDGRIELCADFEECAFLDFTAEEVLLLMKVLCGDDSAAEAVESLLARAAKRKGKG